MITAATSTAVWEWCECDWLDGDHPEIDGSGDVACGCGSPECVQNRFKRGMLHWEGKHWTPLCAFKEAIGRLNT